MYQRIVNPLTDTSFFLFGARGTGKTKWLEEHFPKKSHIWVDLLDEEEFLQFTRRPQTLKEIIPDNHPASEIIIIDEVQRVPGLLNYVHQLIEEKAFIFALTGSSARKLKREGANLLGGRASWNRMHPLTSRELGKDFNLLEVLNWGALPKIHNKGSIRHKQNFLRSYVQTYLKSEIKEEQVVRNLTPFVKFLEVAAQCNGQVLNYSKIARDCGVDSHAVDRYFEILIDTMLGYFLEPYSNSVRKRQIQHSKFYFFDLGVKRALEGLLTVPIVERGGTALGNAFEHFVLLELFRLNDYYEKDFKFSYLRTKDDLEIDLIIERPGLSKVLIEIKSTEQVEDSDIKKLESIRKDLLPNEFWIISREKRIRKCGSATILPWEKALKLLYG
jgi:predicted AAA+ superfamily ATPase